MFRKGLLLKIIYTLSICSLAFTFWDVQLSAHTGWKCKEYCNHKQNISSTTLILMSKSDLLVNPKTTLYCQKYIYIYIAVKGSFDSSLKRLITGCGSVFMGIFDHYLIAKPGLVQHQLDEKAWLAVSILIHPKGLLSVWGHDTVQASQVLSH